MFKHHPLIFTAALFVAFCLLTGCAALDVPTPKSFNERVASGYVSVTGVRTTAATLLNGQVISSDDAVNVQKQADVAREALDVARTLPAIDAENKLTSALTILEAARTYLCAKQPNDPNCVR